MLPFVPGPSFFNSLISEDNTLCKRCSNVRKNDFTKSVKATKPLTYPCLKAVNGCLEANLRVELSQRCPSLRSVDKQSPLKINNLSISVDGLKINSQSYDLTVFSICGKRMRAITNYSVKYLPVIRRNFTENFIQYGKNLNLCQCEPLVATSTEWVAYSKNRRQALTYLYQKVLGNWKNSPIDVNKLEIKRFGGDLGDLGALKFKTSKLEIDSNAFIMLSTIVQNFDESCFPLGCLTLTAMLMDSSQEHKLDHPIIQSAKMIIVRSLTNVLHRFSHLRVHVDWPYSSGSDKIIPLMDYWLRHGKEVGTHFSFTMSTKTSHDALNFWEEVKTKYIDQLGEDQRSTRPFETLIIPTRFLSTICFNIVRGTGEEWICNLKVRKSLI